jgi:hypothetical protein
MGFESAAAAVGFVVAAAAAAWPLLPKRLPSVPVSPVEPEVGLKPAARARWVNDLFVLAGQADAAGEASIAASARSLIAALVAEKELPQKRGR